MPISLSGYSLRLMRLLPAALLLLALNACAVFTEHDPLNVQVVGIQPLPGEGLEWRLAIKLRLQNPNTTAIDYNGLALELEVNGKRLASGVSDQQGSLPRFGERVLTVPVTISAFAAARQAIGLAEQTGLDALPYVLHGKLAAGLFGTQRFVARGTLKLPDTSLNPYRRVP